MKWKTEKQYNRENQWNLSWFAEKTKQNSKIGVPKTRRRKNIEKASYQVRNERDPILRLYTYWNYRNIINNFMLIN